MSGKFPALLEKTFKWQAGKVRFTGRWDRVDFETGGAVITDFKTTEVKDQKEADRRSRESLQLDVYALSFLRTEGMGPFETRLHFLESDLVGRARAKIFEAEEGIRAGEFGPRPDWHNCNYCEFKTICPSSYAF
jgi:DNA helicase-2/ATP-dependent DNA helicase PcrA